MEHPTVDNGGVSDPPGTLTKSEKNKLFDPSKKNVWTPSKKSSDLAQNFMTPLKKYFSHAKFFLENKKTNDAPSKEM